MTGGPYRAPARELRPPAGPPVPGRWPRALAYLGRRPGLRYGLAALFAVGAIVTFIAGVVVHDRGGRAAVFALGAAQSFALFVGLLCAPPDPPTRYV